MTPNETTQKSKVSKASQTTLAYTNLLSLIKELELVYNLSPKLSQAQKRKLLDLIAKIII